MNLLQYEVAPLLSKINAPDPVTGVEVLVFPPMLYAMEAITATSDKHIQVGVQNAFAKDAGAFTGEVSMAQCVSAGIGNVLIGHSERRQYFNEDSDTIREKLKAALRHGLRVVLCFGETLEDRKQGAEESIVRAQLQDAFQSLDETELRTVVWAYEPVWAIGTGEVATAEQAQAMHAFVRSEIEAHSHKGLADAAQILYGGSMKPANAESLLQMPDVDGGLIGGAALKSADFNSLIDMGLAVQSS